jgi:hypothetical protein
MSLPKFLPPRAVQASNRTAALYLRKRLYAQENHEFQTIISERVEPRPQNFYFEASFLFL